jgi:hypothetical protein
MENDVNAEIRRLVEVWCDRRELAALASLLPAWLANNGLTDGWAFLNEAIKHTYAAGRDLPFDERNVLKKLYVTIDVALRNR